MSKKKTALGASAVALLTTVFVAIFGSSTIGKECKGSYIINEVDSYTTEVVLEVPDEFSPDIFTMYMDDFEVDKGIMPEGKVFTHPIVVSDLSRISVVFYVRGEAAGVGTFSDNGVLLIKVKEGFLNA